MAKTRTYKRDAKGRFAGGGAKDPRGPAKVGRAGPRGGKTGTRTQQKKAKQAQQSRTQQFQSKTQASSARDAYKAASRGARMSEKGAAKKAVSKSKTQTRKQPVQNINGQDLKRRFMRLDDGHERDARGNTKNPSPVTKRERQYINETDETKRRTAARKLDKARDTNRRAMSFVEAMAGVRGLAYSRVTSTPEGLSTLAVNFTRRPRYSTRQRVRPQWASPSWQAAVNATRPRR